MCDPNHFKVLELSENASADDVRNAYKRLAKVWHPDKNSDVGAEDRFKQILQSYTYLKSNDRRELHATQLKKRRTESSSSHQPKPSTTNSKTSNTNPQSEPKKSTPKETHSYWWDSFKRKQSYETTNTATGKPSESSKHGKQTNTSPRQKPSKPGKKSETTRPKSAFRSRPASRANMESPFSFPGFVFTDPFEDIMFEIFVTQHERKPPKPRQKVDPFGNKLPKDIRPDIYDWKSATKSPGQQTDYQEFDDGDDEFSCHYCGLLMSMDMLRKHEPRCMRLGGKKKASEEYCFNEEENLNEAYPSTFGKTDNSVPCQWCGDKFNKRNIAEHVLRCRTEAEEGLLRPNIRRGATSKPGWNFDTAVEQEEPSFIYSDSSSQARRRGSFISVNDLPFKPARQTPFSGTNTQSSNFTFF